MHLLQAQPGGGLDADDAVDIAQTPAELVFISANDAEIAALSAARARLGASAPDLRLAQLLWLQHPFSVDRYLDATLTRSKLVVARLLGGEAYWRYGLEQCRSRLAAARVPFAALPGDDKSDPALLEASSVDPDDWRALWAYLVEGGPANAEGFLRRTAAMLGAGPRPPEAAPLLRAGLYAPGAGVGDLEAVRRDWAPDQPVAAIVFYRALLLGDGLAPIDALIDACRAHGLNPLPIFIASLRDPVSAATLERIFAEAPPDVALTTTSFAVGRAGEADGPGDLAGAPLDAPGRPVLQVVLSGGDEAGWRGSEKGLSARDIAMNVALPEVDGRILTRAISFKGEARFDAAAECAIAGHRPRPDRVAFVAELAAAWARLARTPAPERRVALVLANYPNKDGRLANGVGLDTPASTVATLHAMRAAGYAVENAPESAAGLMAQILAGPTNWLTDRSDRKGGERLPLSAYRAAYDALPAQARATVERRWGAPEEDPFFEPGARDAESAFALSIHRFGAVVVGLQPARGYNIDPSETYHSPDLPPPHNYLAFYFWLRHVHGAHAIAHMGKHGNVEWLPGKALALSEACLPEVALGPLPHIYPFIVNDPGEGTQAKRRAQAVVIDHLTPPLTRADTYGPLRDLEQLVDEYYEASGVDPRRLGHLRREILSLSAAGGLDVDAGVAATDDDDSRLRKLDAYLCELKESQIRDGLHVFGEAPQGRLETDLLAALTRAPRGDGAGPNASLIRALAVDLLDEAGDAPADQAPFDPLDCDMAAPWFGPRPPALAAVSSDPWRSCGDVVERLELLAAGLLSGAARPAKSWRAASAVLETVEARLRPVLRDCGAREIAGLLTGLDGGFVAPGPSGAPTRGRLDVLPTGRNFYSVDTRAIPTPAACALGRVSAERLVAHYLQTEGDWPRAMTLTAWGTANMRTGGDDVAQALALMGVRPQWDGASGRVSGFEITPASELGRPRVDVTLRISGFFRDAFPGVVALVDRAARAVMALDEPVAQNPAAAAFRAADGRPDAAHRVFGAKPGAYGAGLQALIDEKIWTDKSDIADAYLAWGGYAYGERQEGAPARAAFEARLRASDAVVQNQDNREHDLLDSDDYYQFEGGAAATIEALTGTAPKVYHNDHSRPERPVIRTLDEEIGRVVRSRAVNPKWIAGVKRHGYKGAFEIAATVDYLFAFAATTHSVRDHHFDLAYAAYLEDAATRDFIADANPAALREIAERFQEAIERGLWRPRSNSAADRLRALTSRD